MCGLRRQVKSHLKKMDSAPSTKRRSNSSKMTKAHVLCPLKCCYCTRRFYSVSSYHSHIKSHEKRYQRFWFQGKKQRPPNEGRSETEPSVEKDLTKEEIGNKLDNDLGHSKKMFVYLVYPPGSLCECNKENIASKTPCNCDFTYRQMVYNSVHQMHRSMQHGVGYTCKQCNKHVMRDLSSQKSNLSCSENSNNLSSSTDSSKKGKMPYVVCFRCGDRFARNEDFEKHHKACSGYGKDNSNPSSASTEDAVKSTDFQCGVCGSFCPDDAGLNDHMKSHAETKGKTSDPAGKVTVIWKDDVKKSAAAKLKSMSVQSSQDNMDKVKLIGCLTCHSASGCQCPKQMNASGKVKVIGCLSCRSANGCNCPRQMKGLGKVKLIGCLTCRSASGCRCKVKVIGCLSCRSSNGCQCPKQTNPLVAIAPKPETRLVLMYECNTCKMKFLTMKELESHKLAFHSISFARIAPTTGNNKAPIMLPIQMVVGNQPVLQKKQGRKSKMAQKKQASGKPTPSANEPKEGSTPTKLTDPPKETGKGKLSADHLYSVLQYKNKWKCEECSEAFKCRDDLRLHIREEHRKGQIYRGKDWVCEICDKNFPSRDKWKGHQKIHKVSRATSQCADCGFHFKSEYCLITHRKEKHPVNTGILVLPTEYVDIPFSAFSRRLRSAEKSKVPLANSSDAVQEPKPGDFVDIPFSAFSRRLRAAAKSKVGASKVTSANTSEEQPASKISTKSGGKKQSQPTPLTPASSGSERPVLQNELDKEGFVVEKSTSGSSKWKCTECSDTFKNRDDMRLHIRLEHRGGVKIRGKEWQCHICNIILSTRDRWKKHGHTHKGENRGACTDCGIYFETRQKFTAHLKEVHGMSSASVSDEHSYTAADIEANERTDSGVWPCNACSCTFLSLKELREHIHSRHREGELNNGECWPCIECLSLFRSLTDLRVHVKAKHQEGSGNTWECRVCGIYFEKSDQMQAHRREHVLPKSIPNKNRWVCSECGEILGTRDELRLHRKDHLRNEHQLKCGQCGWVFGSNRELNDHYDDHVVDFETLKCNECNTDFASYDSLKTHLETHSNLCQLCGFKFTALHNREKHIKVCALEGQSNLDLPEKSNCPECGEEFMKSIQLRLHIARHAMKKEKLKCKLCGQEFKTFKEVELHKQNHKTDCHICFKKFSTVEELNEHMATHIACKYCDRKFESYSSCKRHMSTYCHAALAAQGLGPRRKFPSIPAGRKMKMAPTVERCDCFCDQCGKKFSNKPAMRKHRVIHFRRRFKTPTKCPDCELTFEYGTQLLMHQKKVHWPEKPFACVYCRRSRRFKTSAELQQHELIHITDKRHSCPMCNRKFKELASVRYHLNTHTGVKPYKCKYCPKTFCQPGQKKTHERRHEGHRPYKCSICTATYTYGPSLKIHLQTHIRKGELDKLPEVIHSEELQENQRARNEAIKAAKRERVRRAKEAKEKGYSNVAIGERVETSAAMPVPEEVVAVTEISTEQRLIVDPLDDKIPVPVSIIIPPERTEEQLFENIVAHVQSLGSQNVNNNVSSWDQAGHSQASSQWQSQVVSEAIGQQGVSMEAVGTQQMHRQQVEESAAATLYNMIQR